MIMISVFSVQLSPYALLLLAVTLVADDCIKKHCDKTWVIPSNEDLTIKLSPCDQCTTCDSPFETQTVHAWWSYQLPNGSWTEEIDATVIDHRDYEIKLVDHPLHVSRGPHPIRTGYKYRCEGFFDPHNGTLKDIEITLTAAGASIHCHHEMPVLEDEAVEIWCETGLSDSRVVESSFHFRGRTGPCPSQHNPNPNPNPAFGGYSYWIVTRKAAEPYTCGLLIQNIQPSDSGDYYCEVDVHKVYIMGTPTPVKSRPLHIEVTSPNSTSNPLILEIVIPIAGAGLVLLVVILVVCCLVCYYCGKRRRDNHQPRPQPLPDDPQHPQNPQPPGDGVYGALGATHAPSEHSGQGSAEQSRSTEHGTSSSSGSDPNEMSRSGTDLPHGGRESEGTAI